MDWPDRPLRIFGRAADDSPAYRVFVGLLESGAVWSDIESGRDDPSIKLGDDGPAQPIHASVYAEDIGDHSLVWSRSCIA